jgi:hypothetical protein
MYDHVSQSEVAAFDRLVDGELSSDHRRQLLASLDDRPGGWRQCALAFLEAQAWRGDLGAIALPAVSPPASPATAHIEHASKGGSRAAERTALRWLAVAACLLVAFGLGSLWHSDQPSPAYTSVEQSAAPNLQLATDDRPGQSPTSSTMTPTSPDALTLWVRDNTGAPQRLQVPLVDAGALDRRLGVEFRSALPDSLRDRLRENGYDVHSTRRYAPLWLENGGSLVVPVEDTRIVPASSEVY